MPLSTTFAPAQVDVGAGLSNLMDQFKAARLQSVRRDALSGLMQGGGGEPEYRSSIAKLMAVGDIQGANALTSYYKAAHPELNPYQTLVTGLAQDRLQKDAAQAVINKYPQDRRSFWSENPDQAPPDYRQAQEVLTGTMAGLSAPSGPTLAPTPSPTAAQPVMAPGATVATPTETVSAPKPEHDYNRWKLIQSGKMLPPEAARAAVDSVDQSLDNTRAQAEALLNDENLPNVFGGLVSGLRSGFTTGDFRPGSYNALPSGLTSGSPAAKTEADLEAIRNQASTVVLNALKESGGKLGGSTGLGRVLQSEFAAWQNFFGSLKKETTVEGAKNTLNNMIKFIDQTKARHASTYKADYGDTGIYPDQAPTQDQTVVPPPSAQPTSGPAVDVSATQDPRGPLFGGGMNRNTAPDGHKITDGTHVYEKQNGKWVRVQ